MRFPARPRGSLSLSRKRASILVTGVEDPDSRAHGPNESLHLGEFARVCLAETLLLARVAELVPPASP